MVRWPTPCCRRLATRRACPGRQVISLSGDGGFSMMMGDFYHALQIGLPVKVIVLDNGTLGFVEMEIEGERLPRYRLRPQEPGFCRHGASHGHQGRARREAGGSQAALTEALSHDGPALVDVVSARQELAMPPKTTADQAYHFGMFTMKAVLDGRAGELVDLARVDLRR